MAEFWQQVVSGLATGGIFASLALGIVIVYRATRVVNFAQGEMATFATFVAWSLLDAGVPYWATVVVVLVGAFGGGMLLERVVVRPVARAPVVTAVILTIGLLIALNGLTAWIWGGASRTLPSMFSTRPLDVGGVAFSVQDIGIVAVTLGAVALLALFFGYTKLGLGLRAAAVNPASARLSGVPVGWMLGLGWGIAAALGALAGILVAPSQGSFDPTLMLPILVYALAAAVVGGLDSPAGAVVGGLVVGVLYNLVGRYVAFFGGQMRLVAVLAVVLAVLLVRPHGLFGAVAARRV
jgi:branched-chain amino acid transport system permease protein